MQVEAHDEARSGTVTGRPSGRERVLAAQVAAIGRQPQAAAMDDAVERAVAVVAHVEPLRALSVGAVDQHVAGAILRARRGSVISLELVSSTTAVECAACSA
jgi:hypothetical protein